MSNIKFVRSQIDTLKENETRVLDLGTMTGPKIRMAVSYIAKKDGKRYVLNSKPWRVTRLDQNSEESLSYRCFIESQLNGLTQPGDSRKIDIGDKPLTVLRATLQSFPVHYGLIKAGDGYSVIVKNSDKFDADLVSNIMDLKAGYSLKVEKPEGLLKLVRHLNKTTGREFKITKHKKDFVRFDGQVIEKGHYVVRVYNPDIGNIIRATGVWK